MVQKMKQRFNKMIEARKENSNNEGFTLVELIVVIVILAILIGVTIGGVYGYVNKARVNTDINNASAVQSALQVLTTYNDVTGTANKTDEPLTIDNHDKDIKVDELAIGGITDNGRLAELFPDGIAKSKTGGLIKGKYSTDATGHITSISCWAVASDGTTKLNADAESAGGAGESTPDPDTP